MSTSFDSPLTLEPRRSATLAVILLGVHLGAAVAVAFLPLAWWWKVVLWIVLALSLRRELARDGWLGEQGRMLRVTLEPDDRLSLVQGKSDAEAGRVASAVVYPWAIFLRLRRDGKRGSCTFMLWRDSLPADDFRRARARLKLRNPAA